MGMQLLFPVPSWLCCCLEHPQHVLCLRRPCWPPDRKTTIPFFKNLTASDSARLRASTQTLPQKAQWIWNPLGSQLGRGQQPWCSCHRCHPRAGDMAGHSSSSSLASQPAPGHCPSARPSTPQQLSRAMRVPTIERQKVLELSV